MPRPKKTALQAAASAAQPPDALSDSQSVARVVKAEGSSLYTCALPNTKLVLVELDPVFRNTVWLKRGGYVLVDLASMEARAKEGSRVVGEIVNVVRDEKAWRKMPYWPGQFAKNTYAEDDDDESTVGKMPPTDSDDEDEEHNS